MTFARIASAAAFAFAGMLSASAAIAAPTIVGDVYQEQILKNCSNASFCEVMFTAVPAGKSLVVTDVACVTTVSPANWLIATSLAGRKADNSLVQRNAYPFPSQVSTTASLKRYQLDAEVKTILLSGEKARMYIEANGVVPQFVSICNIVGQLK